MGSPSRNSLAVVDPVLTNFSLEYTQERLVSESGSAFGLTADFIFPRLLHRGDGLSGTYFTYNIKNRFSLPGTGSVRRAAGADYHPVDWDVSSDTYTIEDYGLGHNWDDNEVSAQLSPVDIERDAQETLDDLVLLDYERRVNAIATSGSVITQTSTAAALNGQWSGAGSNPIKDVTTAIKTIYAGTGMRPNRMVIGWDVWMDGIMNNDEVLSRLPDNMTKGMADINPMLVGQKLFNLDMRVNTGIIDTAAEGQTASLSTSGTGTFGKNVLVFYANPTPRVKSKTLGMTIHKDDWFTVRKRDVGDKSHRVTVSQMTSEKTVAAALGYLITAAVA